MGYVHVKRRGDSGSSSAYHTRRFSIEVCEPSAEALVGRIVIDGRWSGRPEDARRLLGAVAAAWPKRKKVKFLITCGCFVRFDWPEGLEVPRPTGATNATVRALDSAAQETCQQVLTAPLRRRLLRCTRLLTIGADSSLDGLPYIDQPHVELVALVDLKSNTYHWTGKSYPTMAQQRQLVRVGESSHFANAGGDRVLVLGCHDLNLFSPRVWKRAKGWRAKASRDFRLIARRKRPTVVLQHPHTTDSRHIWSTAWYGLAKTLPTVRAYASAGRYYNEPGKPPRGDLDGTLERTRYGETLDLIVRLRRPR